MPLTEEKFQDLRRAFIQKEDKSFLRLPILTHAHESRILMP